MHRHRGSFWKYNPQRGCYEQSEDDDIKAAIWTFLEDALQVTKNGMDKFKPTRAKAGDVFEALGVVCNLDARIDPPAWLDGIGSGLPAAIEFVACTNGLVHLPTRRLYSRTPQFFALNASDVAFDPAATSPRWQAFLKQLFDDDEQAAAALQDWFGYSVSADTAQQKIMMLVGPTRSGKGTIGRVLTRVVGRESVAAPTLASLSTNFGLEPLISKSLAIVSDARIGRRSDQTIIAERLLSISGEDTLTIDRKHRSAWTGRLATRVMLLTNELPRMSDNSGSLAKRFVLVLLTRSFYGVEDHSLEGKLVEELPGIFNWACDGFDRVHNRGHFEQPDSSIDAVEEMEELNSLVKAFVRETCTIGHGLAVSASELYVAWANWCAANNCKPTSNSVFGRDLKTAFATITKPRFRAGGERTWSYGGIALVHAPVQGGPR